LQPELQKAAVPSPGHFDPHKCSTLTVKVRSEEVIVKVKVNAAFGERNE
jgi:hypothetical protein